MIGKSVQTINQIKSSDHYRAGVIQTGYYIVKAHGVDLMCVKEKNDTKSNFNAGLKFLIHLPLNLINYKIF